MPALHPKYSNFTNDLHLIRTSCQVSIAVLLDNFLAASNKIKEEKKLRVIKENRGLKQVKNPLHQLQQQL
jgi:hypothetical protein